MEILSPYHAPSFNRLPSLEESNSQFRSLNGPEVVYGDLLKVFSRYPQMAKSFGVILLHRHFALDKDQLLVATNGSSTAWDLPSNTIPYDSVFSKYGGIIRPSSWFVRDDGRLVPYEFQFDIGQSRDAIPGFDPSFVADFVSVVTKRNLRTVLGLVARRPEDPHLIEVTEGNANINFPASALDIDSSESLEAIWSYFIAEPGGEHEAGDDHPAPMDQCSPTTRCLSEQEESSPKTPRHTKVHPHIKT